MSRPSAGPSSTHFLCSENNDAAAGGGGSNLLQQHNLELQLLPSSNANPLQNSTDENYATKLSLGSSSGRGHEIDDPKSSSSSLMRSESKVAEAAFKDAARFKQGANEQLRMAISEKAFAEEARQQAKRQMEEAEMEFSKAKRIRQAAQTELEKAQLLKEQATTKINETISEITCHSCKKKFQATNAAAVIVDETSPAMSYMSSATTDAEGE